MCGIVGAVAQRDVGEILLESLRRLEYRGYDSAGMVVVDNKNQLQRLRTVGKVENLSQMFEKKPLLGAVGIAHTRWATHGKPSERNAHPHQSGKNIALVHNGIIENHSLLQNKLIKVGYKFNSDTDTEKIAHLINLELEKSSNLLQAVKKTANQLIGAFALGIIDRDEPHHLIAVRSGSPLVIGLGIGENFIASDVLALLSVTQKFIFLEDGDIADIYRNKVKIYDKDGKLVNRSIHISDLSYDKVSMGKYRHFMLKEIFDQPDAIRATLEGYDFSRQKILTESFGQNAAQLFAKVKRIQIAACGTSYHAGMVARYWLEEIANIPCQVEIASEIRYRKTAVSDGTLFLTISQSGETADTLAALRQSKEQPYIGSLAICNVAESSLVRESDLVFITRAGTEVGVASTKAFTAQLTALLILTFVLAQKKLAKKMKEEMIISLKSLSAKIFETLKLNNEIKKLAYSFSNKHHALFLGRGIEFPIASEGALKLKEISYIHAEAYPAGELKHGPLALVDEEMPVIVLLPNNGLLEKMKSNLQEVRARGGKLIIFAPSSAKIKKTKNMTIIKMPETDDLIAPVIYTVPLQLLAYHVALIKGTDVDHPRNLAKSVTVE